jgi:hypothetical protein
MCPTCSESRPLGTIYRRLQSVAPASTKEKEENNDQQDEAEPATAVVANAWPHVVAAPAGQHKKNHKNEYQWHKRSNPLSKACTILKRSSSWKYHLLIS